MAKRTVEEIKKDMVGLKDLERELALASEFNIRPERVQFICACAEDDLSDEGWKSAFKACEGKLEEEIVDIMYNLTTWDEEAPAQA